MMMIASRSLTRSITRVESRRFASSLTSFEATTEQKNRELIDKIIRVDHAGELAADRIYAGQMAVLGRTDVGPTIQVMEKICDGFIRTSICLAYVGRGKSASGQIQ